MAPLGSVFSNTLQTITTTKLEELSKQRLTFAKEYSTLIITTEAEKDPIQQLLHLVNGVKICLNVKTAKTKTDGRLGRTVRGGSSNSRLETDLGNLEQFIEQARYDPSISPKVLGDWKKCMLQYLSVQSSKYAYADLYGKLVTEWLSAEKTATSDGDVEMMGSFEELPGIRKLEARTEWEKIVFEPGKVDTLGLDNYLQKLFITKKKHSAKAIDGLRGKVEHFESTFTGTAPFTTSTLRWVIHGLQSSDLLNNEKREVLKDFLSNDVILSEIADVLNMRMAALGRWTWGDHVTLEQRRRLNGTYSIHMHEDLLQAIFLHYIGVKWSVFFKNAFLSFRSEAWKSSHAVIHNMDKKRREYYLGYGAAKPNYPNLHDKRENKHRARYFAHQLLDHETQRIEVQEGEEEAEFSNFIQAESEEPSRKRSRKDESDSGGNHALQQHQIQMQQAQMQQAQMQQAQMQQALPQASYVRQSNMAYQQPQVAYQQHAARQHWGPQGTQPDAHYDNDEDIGNQQAKKPMEAKQGILHILSTEIIINTRIYGDLTCFRSVFESWNPLLPHDTIITVLKFFGVSEKWATFFITFLQAPLKFDDDGSATPRLRRRGTPGSHALSDVFGEAILFCLDFSVNQHTDGAMLYRMYDDFWFWSHDYERCVKAWSSVLQFTKAMGVNLNNSKTGSVRIGHDSTSLDIDDLPQGEIRWGFLFLDPSTSRFEIDMEMVNSHIEELRQQLQSKSKSVIDWIQAWNSYAATFFSSNFGKAANCFGREHVDKMLATHRYIQERIFEGKGGDVVQFLKNTIKERFEVDDVPDGFLFFPVELGGLDLKSPFVGLLQIREGVLENPYDLLNEFEEAEQEAYTEAMRVFDRGDAHRGYSGRSPEPKWKPESDADKFFSFEEYVRYREEYSGNGRGRADLVRVYQELLRKPKEESVNVTVQVENALDQLRGQTNLRGITSHWDSMEAYWKWIAQMYGPEMVTKFGGLNVVDPGLLPIGMVSMFRQMRMKWQG